MSSIAFGGATLVCNVAGPVMPILQSGVHV